MDEHPRLSSPSALRNRAPILETLRPHLPRTGLVLEIASGTGEHAAYLAAACPELSWQPTDPDSDRRASVDAWTASLPNVRPALDLDVRRPDWPVARAEMVLCINMIHIAPWPATLGLFAGSARVLPPGGTLALYGPFRREGRPLEPGNLAFDLDLRRRDPDWGLRTVEAVTAVAASDGFEPPIVAAMPSDNLTLLFRRR